MCVLYGLNFAHIVHRSYIIVGRLVIPNLGHFGSPGSLTNWYHSGKMPLSHDAICYKGLPHDLMMKSRALNHIYRTYIASGRTCSTSHDCHPEFPVFVVHVGRGSISLSMRQIGKRSGGIIHIWSQAIVF